MRWSLKRKEVIFSGRIVSMETLDPIICQTLEVVELIFLLWYWNPT